MCVCVYAWLCLAHVHNVFTTHHTRNQFHTLDYRRSLSLLAQAGSASGGGQKEVARLNAPQIQPCVRSSRTWMVAEQARRCRS